MALYQDLITHFRERILDGSLPAGSQLPTEMQLAEQHQISRHTVRHAMSALVNQGFLDRVQGRGTFVRRIDSAAATGAQERRIGLIIHHMRDIATPEIIVGVEQAVKARGYQVSFAYSDERLEQEASDIARLLADRVAGLIIFPVSDVGYDEAIWRLQQDGVPVVLIDRYCTDLDTDYVGVDNFGGGYRATQHLIILGHTRIGFVYSRASSLRTTSVRDRWQGYRAALDEYGLPHEEELAFQQPPEQRPSGHGYYEDYLQRSPRPDAVFAVNDMVAIELLEDARRCGLRVPEDLALVGFDDLSYAARLHPPLTTVAQPRMDLGLRAGALLLDRIEGLGGQRRQIVLPTNLIVRASCGARLRARKVTDCEGVTG